MSAPVNAWVPRCGNCLKPLAPGESMYCHACWKNMPRVFVAHDRRELGTGCPYCGKEICRGDHLDCQSIKPEPIQTNG